MKTGKLMRMALLTAVALIIFVVEAQIPVTIAVPGVKLGLSNVHFLSFQKKDRLAQLYQAADMFVLPTREDIWGLVINEALAYGLPTITTDRCVAGLELIEDGVNGYVVPVGDEKALAEKIRAVLSSDREKMGQAALEKVRPYTLENMAKTHAEIFENGR